MAAMSSTPEAGATPRLVPLRPLLGELNDLKRIRVAGRAGSLADQGFARSWAALVAGESPVSVATREAASALASARLGGIDAATLRRAGLSPKAIEGVFGSAIAAVAGPLGPGPAALLRAAIPGLAAFRSRPSEVELPAFVALLAAQPRAGATRPGQPRLVLEPPEGHAEHCYVTAVYAFLLSPGFGADPTAPFLAGLAHHFHNAYLPDSGFAGEDLLGEHLGPVMARFTAEALGQLPRDLAVVVESARGLLPHAGTPEARAFHAADVLDRVLQMDHYAQVAAFELRLALDDLDLVHPGPLQAFHREVLAAAGLPG